MLAFTQKGTYREVRYPSRWRPPVTVCIAALCDKMRTVIMIADQRVGMEFVEGDLALKIAPLSSTWRVLLAGNDFSAAVEIARKARHNLAGSVSVDDVQEALSEAYQEVRLSRIEANVLRSRGWTIDEFKEKGSKLLPEAVYSEIDSELEKYDLEVALLAGGFDGPYGALVSVSNPGKATIETNSYFDAIGVGDTLALASLYRRKYTDEMPLGIALYYAYEAKVEAERASSVGEPSYVIVLKRGKQGFDEIMIPEEQHHYMRMICDELKPRNLSVPNLETMDVVVHHGLSLRKSIQKSLSGPHHPVRKRRLK